MAKTKPVLRLVDHDWPDDGPPDGPSAANGPSNGPSVANGQLAELATPRPAKRGKPDRAAPPMARPVPPPRRHVTPAEADSLIAAAGEAGRNATRDRALLLVTYRHGLRVAEVTALRWSAIDWTTEQIHIGRVKNGNSGHHPITGAELRILRKLKREAEDGGQQEGHIFVSEQGGPMSPDSVARIVARAGVLAGIGFHVHPHMLRHGIGYYLVRKKTDLRTIQAYLGHTQISSTVRYTALDPGRFDGLIKD